MPHVKHLFAKLFTLQALIVLGFIAVFGSAGLYALLSSNAASPLKGDINGDGVINQKDAYILADNWGKTEATADQGDLNGDGVIDVKDLGILSVNYHITLKAPDTFVINGKKMVSSKINIDTAEFQIPKAAVIRAGDLHLADPLWSVMDKPQVPPSGSKHDYYSLAPYSWPNPNTANGLPYIDRDGFINPEFYDITDHAYLQSLATAVTDLSAAYYFTNDTKYSSKATQMIRTWFINSATKMNPNLKYTAVVKGVNQGHFPGIIEGAVFPKIIDAVQILRLSPNWAATDQTGFTNWSNSYYTWLTTSNAGISESGMAQNHGTWYNVQKGTLAEFIGNHAGAIQAVNKGKALINTQVSSNGHQPLEMARNRPWNYSTFNLEGLTALAQIGERENIHLWNYTAPLGGSIHKAIDFLKPYAKDPKTWPYTDHDPWRPWLMDRPLRQAATAYNDSSYSLAADDSLTVNPTHYYTSLMY